MFFHQNNSNKTFNDKKLFHLVLGLNVTSHKKFAKAMIIPWCFVKVTLSNWAPEIRPVEEKGEGSGEVDGRKD